MKLINKNLLICLLIILSIVGVFDASYLTAKHYLSQSIYCPVGQTCEIVLTSQYATLYGIPIALFGAIFYLTELMLALLYFETRKKIFLKIFFALSSFSLLASAYLVYLQLFVINAICFYCMVSAINILILFGVSLFLLFSWKD